MSSCSEKVQASEPKSASTDRFTDLRTKLPQTFDKRGLTSLDLLLASETPATWALRMLPPEELFSPDEQALLATISAAPEPAAESVRPHTVIILKATRLCNLRCTYCNSWRAGPGNIMPLDTLAKLTRDILRAPNVRQVDFVWHGGEVTLLPVNYLKKALWIQQYFVRPQTTVHNSIQTNATRLSGEWVRFLKEYGLSVGVSIDGPPEVHDARRIDAQGNGSWRDVRRGLDALVSAGIRFGALAVVDECVIKIGARAYLEYLVKLGVKGVALLNAIPPNGSTSADQHCFPFQSYTSFLKDLFREWWLHWRESIEIRELQAIVDAVRDGYTPLCIFRENCMGRYLTVEPNGDVSACDKFVGDPAFVFGNLRAQSLAEMLAKSEALATAIADVDAKKSRMETCSNYRICMGGCPHDVRLADQFATQSGAKCCGLSELIMDVQAATAL